MEKLGWLVVIQGHRRQWQSGAAENRAAGLIAWRCDVGLTSTWFEAALLDVSGSPDLPDISMNVTLSVTAIFFIFTINIAEHLYLKRDVARVYIKACIGGYSAVQAYTTAIRAYYKHI